MLDSPVAQLIALKGPPRPVPSAPPAVHPDDVEALAEQVMAAFELERPTPSPSQQVAFQVIHEAAQATSDAAVLARLIQRDAALTGSVLRVANSAAYQGAQEVVTVREAVARLGGLEVGRIAAVVAARALLGGRQKQEQAYFAAEFTACSEDAQVTARVASAVALTLPGVRADEVFLAGMLHDVGRAMALRCLASLTQCRGHLAAAVVAQTLDRVHVALGTEVHEAWDLPRFLTLAAERHHDVDLPDEAPFKGVHVVRLVSAMVQQRRQGALSEAMRAELDASARALKLDGYALRAIDTQVGEAQARFGPKKP